MNFFIRFHLNKIWNCHENGLIVLFNYYAYFVDSFQYYVTQSNKISFIACQIRSIFTFLWLHNFFCDHKIKIKLNFATYVKKSICNYVDSGDSKDFQAVMSDWVTYLVLHNYHRLLQNWRH